MVEFLLSSGVRLSELTQLNIDDIDMQDGLILLWVKVLNKVFFNERTMIHLKNTLDSREGGNPAMMAKSLHIELQQSGVETLIELLRWVKEQVLQMCIRTVSVEQWQVTQ